MSGLGHPCVSLRSDAFGSCSRLISCLGASWPDRWRAAEAGRRLPYAEEVGEVLHHRSGEAGEVSSHQNGEEEVVVVLRSPTAAVAAEGQPWPLLFFRLQRCVVDGRGRSALARVKVTSPDGASC